MLLSDNNKNIDEGDFKEKLNCYLNFLYFQKRF